MQTVFPGQQTALRADRFMHNAGRFVKRACGIFSEHRPPETVCGVVRNVGREGESFEIMTLRELAEYPADMFTTVFIGNEDTRVINGKMVTLRGYKR